MRMKLKRLTATGLAVTGALLLTAALAAPTVWAEDAKEREIKELRALVEKLGQRLNQLENQVGAKKEVAAASAAVRSRRGGAWSTRGGRSKSGRSNQESGRGAQDYPYLVHNERLAIRGACCRLL
jgi:hypothetical protein